MRLIVLESGTFTITDIATRVLLSQLFKNSNWNVAAFLVALLANFVALPVVIRRIGIAQLGAAGVLIGMLAPLMLVGAVIAQACVREVPAQLARGRSDEARRTFWAGIWLCAGCCFVVVVVVGLGGAVVAKYLMGETGPPQNILRRLCLITGVGWAAQQFLAVLQSGLAATQSYKALAIANAVGAIIASVSVIIATTVWPSVEGFLIGTAAGFTISAFLSLLQLRGHAPLLFPMVLADQTATLQIVAFGRWQAGSHIIGAVALQADRFILGATSMLFIAGQLNIATRLQEVVYTGVLKVTEVVFPYFAASAERPVEERVPFLLMSAWLTNMVAAAVLSPLVPLGGALIGLWVGSDAMATGRPILSTLATAGLIGCGMNVFIYFMLGQGYGKRLAVVNIIHGLTVVATSIFLLSVFGPNAAGGGFLIANTLRLGFIVWQMPSLTGRTHSPLAVAQTTQIPIIGGLLVAWAPWPVTFTVASNWALLLMLYVLFAIAVLIACVIISLAFTTSRRFLLNLSHGLFRFLPVS